MVRMCSYISSIYRNAFTKSAKINNHLIIKIMPVEIPLIKEAGQEAESKQNQIYGMINQGMGAIFGAKQAKKAAAQQQEYSKELMEIQNQYNIDAVNRQYMNELNMFEATGYAAKTRQMKEAGLNPALIYGMGAGGGGGVTGNISAPTVSGQSAPDMMHGQANSIAQQGMGLQLAKMQSEIAVNNSIADLNRATASKTEGVETSKLKAETIGQELENQLTEIKKQIAGRTVEDQITAIKAASDKAVYEAEGAIGTMKTDLAKGTIDLNTIDDQLTIINQTIAKSYIEIAALKEGINLSIEKRTQIANEIEQKWQELNYNTVKMSAETTKILKEAFNNDLSKSDEFINDLVNKLIPSATIIPGLNKINK